MFSFALRVSQKSECFEQINEWLLLELLETKINCLTGCAGLERWKDRDYLDRKLTNVIAFFANRCAAET